ncbi:MAG: FecR domain-containing protein [Chitinophagaceae bacterium]|nr:FecR domain-containing protein [Chitinophagaceae bacterium]
MEDNEHIRLITRHLSQETSPEEEASLQKWLTAAPEHRLEFEALKDIWHTSGAVVGGRTFDKAVAWKNIAPQIIGALPDTSALLSPVQPRPTGLRRPLWPRTLAAACALLLLLGAGWRYYTIQRHPSMQKILASGNNQQISLPDGSLVWLRKGAEMEYPSSFSDRLRQVELNGEAFFQPATDPSRPFRINTPHAVIEDIGTTFLVKDEDAGGEVIVTSGKVKLTGKEDAGNPLILLPGQKATILKNKLSVTRLGTSNFMSWKTGLLEFRQAPLEQVVQDISDHYSTPVSVAPELKAGAGEIKVTARFDHQPLHQVLDEIKLTTGLQTAREKDTLFFVRQ